MCGICVTNKKYNNSMSHRGTRTRKLIEDKLTFVHEHLAIQAPQGYNSIIESGKYIILFNGELFLNDYDNDLEYIHDIFLDLPFDEAINDILNQDGFYSFIIYNSEAKIINCFTDPLGKKQLYFSQNGIASEIRALNGETIDNLFMSRTIKFGYVTDDSTPYNEIKRILPNMLYSFDSNFRMISRVDELYRFKVRRNENLYDLIHEAVINRMKGHKAVGLLLSGGLDSSIIDHHIVKANYLVNRYCVDNLSDVHYAKMLDVNINLVKLSYNEKALAAMEMPLDLGSLYPQYDLFAKVNETVIMTGDGADEVFGGYKRMNQYDSQLSDIFDELRFYHNIRIDRMSMTHTKEARSPFMSLKVVEYGLGLPYKDRVNKQYLRDIYKGILPDEIVERGKEPLKTDIIREKDGVEYRAELVAKWLRDNK